MRKECRLRVFENRVLKRIFGAKKNEVTGSGEDYMTRSFILCTPTNNTRMMKSRNLDGYGM